MSHLTKPKYFFALHADGQYYFSYTRATSEPYWYDQLGPTKAISELDNSHLKNLRRMFYLYTRSGYTSYERVPARLCVKFSQNWLQWCDYEIARRRREGLM